MGHSDPTTAKLEVGYLAIIDAVACFDLLFKHTSAVIRVPVNVMSWPLREYLDNPRTPDVTAMKNVLY